MWQRFTEGARTAILYAQEEAMSTKSPHVGGEHLLLGLLRNPQTVSTRVLNEFGISHQKVFEALSSQGHIGPETASGEPKLTPQGKRTLELAADSARRLRHDEIGTGHLLLALLMGLNDSATTTLQQLGADFDGIRARVEENLHLELSQRESTVPHPPPAQKSRGTLVQRYMPDFEERSGIPPADLEALDVGWAALSNEKETAIYYESYELAAALQTKMDEFEQEFIRRAKELGFGA
jgi:ATP-dependent Clp protease ATP-binding subunit ClpA